MLESYLASEEPQRVYFPFWSHMVPEPILLKYKCIGFHLGEEAGGSPIQHAIRSGKTECLLKAFLMTTKLDRGKHISIHSVQLHGSLEEIILRMSKIITEMIDAQENYEQSNS